MADAFQLNQSPLSSEARIVGFTASERLNQPFELIVYASVPGSAVPTPDDALAAPLSMSLLGEEGAEMRHFHGFVRGLALVDEAFEDRALLRLHVAPKVWRLSRSSHSRVFTKTSIPDVIRAVLEGEEFSDGTDFSFDVQGSYAEQAHVCQYKESDLAFITRWMEHEGLYYFFEHTSSGHKMVITDHKTAHKPCREDPVRYQPAAGGDLGRDCFERFSSRRRVLAKKIRLVDYNYENPSLDASGEADASDKTSSEVVVHGARFTTPDEGKRLAGIRSEEHSATENTFEATGTVFGIAAGYTFTLSEHPRDALNTDYLCTWQEHRGNLRAQSEVLKRLIGTSSRAVYEVDVGAIPADCQFRAVRETPSPRIYGLERAVVGGPAESDYAQLDDQGRYAVKLGFDESDLSGDKSSVRMRMLQPHAGNPEGMHFPLRAGTEVLVAFLAGDPDRPLIAGAVPNAETPSPVTSENHTRNIIVTGGDNVIEIEDQDGAQWIDIRCPVEDSYLHLGTPYNPTHYITGHTSGNCFFDIGTNMDIRVGGKLTEDVTKNVKETYDTSQKSTITGPQKTEVKGDTVETFSGGHITTVTEKVTEVYGAGQKTEVKASVRNECYEANHSVLVLAGTNHEHKAGLELTVQGGGSLQVYDGTKATKATGRTDLKYSGSLTQRFGATTGTYGPTTLNVTGACDVFTSEWKLMQTNWWNLGNLISALKVQDQKIVGLSIEIVMTKAEAVGATFSISPLKAEHTTFSFNAAAINLSVAGKVNTKGLELKLAALKLDG